MQRTKFKKATAILTADWHLREDIPDCRTDDFETAQWDKIRFISDLQKKHNCPVLHAGDLFHHWKPSPRLITLAIRYLPDNFYTIYGQHDLPQHNIQLSEKCGINTLIEAGKIKLLDGCHWDQVPEYESFMIDNKKILVWHIMTYTGVAPWPGCVAPQSMKLLKKYPQFDLILTGDNHKPFTVVYKKRLHVNPGNITRQAADQINYHPRIYLWYIETNTVEAVYLPISDGVISKEHLERKQKRDNRIEAFVERLNTEWESGISFEENLQRFKQNNNIPNEVMQIIYKSIEKSKL
ncbi:MAG: metallophosphoesterase family protein [Thiohalospira sp.]